MTANKVEIKNAAIAIASKDMSEMILNNINIHESEVGLAVFQKKPEFGPASIIANNLKMNTTELPYLIEKKSLVVIDGIRMKSDKSNIKDILYGVVYGKSSK